MQYRKFGNSDLETSVVGFGGWPVSTRRRAEIEGNADALTVK